MSRGPQHERRPGSCRLRRREVIEVPVRGQELPQSLAGVEHAGFHRVPRPMDYVGDLFDGLFVIYSRRGR